MQILILPVLRNNPGYVPDVHDTVKTQSFKLHLSKYPGSQMTMACTQKDLRTQSYLKMYLPNIHNTQYTNGLSVRQIFMYCEAMAQQQT